MGFGTHRPARSIAVIVPLLIALAAPAPAVAITRPQVVARAHKWVKRRVRYSQTSSYQGYRRDCSGFISMAWKLRRSYTTRTLPSVARRVHNKSRIRPGDLMLVPGHARLFVKWANRSHTKFVSYEEANHREGSVRKIVSFAGHKAYRYKWIKPVKHKKKHKKVVKPVVAPLPSITPTPSVTPSASIEASPVITPVL